MTLPGPANRDMPGAQRDGASLAVEATGALRVWDLPTRIAHWLLTLLVAAAVITAKIGSSAMTWHARIGTAILVVVLFRILWGFAGPHHARFANFVVGPRAILRYLRQSLVPRRAGHNPLGAVSVLVLLAVLLLQAVFGLFAVNESGYEAPLSALVSLDTSELLTRLHRLNEKLIYLLIALHLAAIAWWRFARRAPLVRAMVSGDQHDVVGVASRDDALIRIRAALLLVLLAALAVWIIGV